MLEMRRTHDHAHMEPVVLRMDMLRRLQVRIPGLDRRKEYKSERPIIIRAGDGVPSPRAGSRGTGPRFLQRWPLIAVVICVINPPGLRTSRADRSLPEA